MILFSTAVVILLFATPNANAYNNTISALQKTVVKINQTLSTQRKTIEVLEQEKSNNFVIMYFLINNCWLVVTIYLGIYNSTALTCTLMF